MRNTARKTRSINVLTDEEIDNIKADDLVAILHSLVNYKHTILYYGPQTAVQTGAVLTKLHKTPATFLPYPAAKKFTRTKADKNTVLFGNFDMVQAEIQWIRNEDAYDAAKAPTLIELFNNYFGGGISSIVFQNIRESKALAYSTYAYYVESQKKEDEQQFCSLCRYTSR
jgi:predicted Zn-dependent peptidase